ncbi:hypothetical protein PAHAL_9G483100 [Panicum hallii]|uniref:Arf-GAP domain-containing protein n=1 Tax=Panicum hallii TaxID=206008 RepID=A0A2S3IR30_9POAL|nr:probable ADP-ribosylation factor GTPase-activating protein AGD14 isoform X2 [Panicum hallii]PAN49897.1 hypothetical protein PAHAL_9G483100 [Panicum hallii]
MVFASRKEEERNERIVRGLLKLPPNRRCVNCNGLGPQYVCTSFWTFVCVSCSGIHREFTHRVKSVSMSTFSTPEVEALQKGGNQRARESFLKDFDTQKMRLPDSSNIGNLREFIKAVYVERRYAGGRFSERPPRDKQNQKAHEEEHRRASSYHSFSQSPPYDYQYEEQRNGKQSAFLSRKPGSDRGLDGKISGFAYSSHSLHERMSEDRFAGESCGSRTSNFSGSSMSDTVRTAPQSPNFPDNGWFSAPVLQDQSNQQSSYGLTSSQITMSAGNIDSISPKLGKSSLSDLIFEDDNVQRTQKSANSAAPSFIAFSDAISAPNQDHVNSTAAKKHGVTTLEQPIDLFANMPTETLSADKVIPAAAAPSIDNSGWATFDTPPEQKQPSVTGLSYVAATSNDKQALSHDLFSFESNDEPTWFQSSKDNASVTNQSTTTSPDTGSSQLWHSFDDVDGVVSHDQCYAQPQNDDHRNVVNISLSTSNPFMCSVVSKEGTSTEHTPLNPFDLPFDTHSGTPDLFMDMSSLQEALPNPDLPTFLDGLPETWFSSSSRAYVPSASHGGLPCLVEQAPNSPLRNIPLPVGTASTGNPFA